MKGTVQDLIIICVIAVAVGFIAMIGYTVIQQFGLEPEIAANPQAAATVAQGLSALALIGNSLIFVIMGFGMVSVIAAYYTDTHPVFFIFSVFVFAVTIMICSIVSQMFVDLANSDALLPVAAQFYTLIQVMGNFPVYALIIGAMILIALYTKRSSLEPGAGGYG